MYFFTDIRVPVGTTELNQIQDRTYTDTGVPVGTTELDQRQDLSDTGLTGYRSTRRYYGTDQIWTEFNQMLEYP